MLLNEANLANRPGIIKDFTKYVKHEAQANSIPFDVVVSFIKKFIQYINNIDIKEIPKRYPNLGIEKYRPFAGDPEWMHKDGVFYVYTNDPGNSVAGVIWVVDRIYHALDYIGQLPEREQNKLYKISYEQMLQKVRDWDAEMLAKSKEANLDATNSGEVIIDFGDGYKFIKLNRTEEAYKYEGDIMGHCVEGYVDNEMSIIYSLRDKNNEPHVTIEVSMHPDYGDDVELIDVRGIVQIKGKGNEAPIPKYIPYVLAFIEKTGYAVYEDGENIGWKRVRIFPDDEEVNQYVDDRFEDYIKYIYNGDILKIYQKLLSNPDSKEFTEDGYTMQKFLEQLHGKEQYLGGPMGVRTKFYNTQNGTTSYYGYRPPIKESYNVDPLSIIYESVINTI